MQHTYDGKKIHLVLYHKNCSDGHAAAAIADKFLNPPADGSAPTVFMALPPNPDPVECAGMNVLVLDLSFSKENMLKMMASAASILVIDHHKTAVEELKDIPDENKMFDNSKCGAVLTWDYFYNNVDGYPLFLQYVQSRDIWTQDLPYTNEVWELTHPHRDGFADFQNYIFGPRAVMDQIIDEAKAIKAYKDDNIKHIVESKVTLLTIEMDGALYIVGYFNTPLYISEAGNEILKRYSFVDFACNVQFDFGHEETYMSLRSDDQRADVSAIAKRLGGGGHRNAAGLKLSGIQHRLPFRHVDVDLVWEVAKRPRENVDWNGLSYTVVRVPMNKYTINFSKGMIDLLKTKFNDIEGIVYEAAKTEFLLNFSTCSLHTGSQR